jgi:hypothetical protein
VDDCSGLLVDLSHNGSKQFLQYPLHGNQLNMVAFRRQASAATQRDAIRPFIDSELLRHPSSQTRDSTRPGVRAALSLPVSASRAPGWLIRV